MKMPLFGASYEVNLSSFVYTSISFGRNYVLILNCTGIPKHLNTEMQSPRDFHKPLLTKPSPRQ